MNIYFSAVIVALSLSVVGCASTDGAGNVAAGSDSVIELERQVKITVPENFEITTGPKDLDIDNYTDKQPVLAIFDKPKQIVCQVAINVYSTDPGEGIAMKQTRDDYKSMDMDAIKEIDGNPSKVEAVTSYTQSSGTDLTFVTHTYYLPPVQSVAKKAQVYQILCGTETASYSQYEPIIRQILDSIEWI